jgi:hypothetical protein
MKHPQPYSTYYILLYVLVLYRAVLRHTRKGVTHRIRQQPQSEGLEPLKRPTIEPHHAAGNASDRYPPVCEWTPVG